MPTVEDITKILTDMDPDKYYAAVSYIYYLAKIPESSTEAVDSKEEQRCRQIKFVERTAGKIQVDEKAIEELRMGSMI